MDRELQKLILEIIAANNGIAEWKHIRDKVLTRKWRNVSEQERGVAKVTIKHQMDLMEGEGVVMRKEQIPDIYYIMTSSGHRILWGLIQRSWYFIIFNKEHNVFSVIALAVSIISLVVGFIALYR